MENSFFHKRAGGLVLAALPPGVHVPSRKSENSALCRDGLAASGEEGKVLPLFILQSLSSCLWCSCPFQFFVRRPFFFQRKKRFHGRSVFCSSAGILRCVLFRLSSWVGLSAGTPRGAQVSRRLGKRTAAEKWRRFCKFQRPADPLSPRGTAVCGLCSGYGEGIRTFSLGARKGVSPRRHTVFSSFVVPFAAFWSRQIPGRYFGRKSV